MIIPTPPPPKKKPRSTQPLLLLLDKWLAAVLSLAVGYLWEGHGEGHEDVEEGGEVWVGGVLLEVHLHVRVEGVGPVRPQHVLADAADHLLLRLPAHVLPPFATTHCHSSSLFSLLLLLVVLLLLISCHYMY